MTVATVPRTVQQDTLLELMFCSRSFQLGGGWARKLPSGVEGAGPELLIRSESFRTVNSSFGKICSLVRKLLATVNQSHIVPKSYKSYKSISGTYLKVQATQKHCSPLY